MSIIVISIHAPTRGATIKPAIYDKVSGISIHAPTRGATPTRTPTANPHLISIHAPTRGATYPNAWCYIIIGDFNPRSYKRSDTEKHLFI